MFRRPKGLAWKIPVLCLCCLLLLVYVHLELPCMFRQLTGIPCPGCGMSRAWLAFFRLDLAGAFSWHPMFWAVPVVAVFALFDCRPFQNDKANTFCLSALAVALAACYAIRLVEFLSGGAI